jgi:hypothetical protein
MGTIKAMSAFEELQAISDQDLASQGIIRLSSTMHLNANAIVGFEARMVPKPALFLMLLPGGERAIPSEDGERVLKLMLRSFSARKF